MNVEKGRQLQVNSFLIIKKLKLKIMNYELFFAIIDLL
jgi:hypothetical protein